jgi:hypothetical protein
MAQHPLTGFDANVSNGVQRIARRGGDCELMFIGPVEGDSNPIGPDGASGLLDDTLTDGVDVRRTADSTSEFVEIDELSVCC